MVKKIQINMSDKLFYTLIVLGVVGLLTIGVYAYGTSNPSVMGHSSGEVEGVITSGFCIFSDTQASCPSGWTRRTQFDGRTIKGASTSGGTGGSESHSHTVDIWANDKTGIILSEGTVTRTFIKTAGSVVASWGTELLETGPQKGKRETTADTSSWSPYMNVIICCKD